jgi:hypothetical protein
MPQTTRSAKRTTDHNVIRKWVEERDGHPACVRGTGGRRGKDDPGMIRIDFPGWTGEESLEPIDWNDWFRAFDQNNLAFLYRDMKQPDGSLDRFNKLVSRDSDDED